MKKFKLIICLSLLFLLCGCGNKGKMHEYENFINYVDNLQCGMNGKSLDCDLAGKYEIISDETETITEEDDIRYNNRVAGSKKRTLTFKIKNTDLTFDVVSRYVCTGEVDGSCFEFTYKLLDDFQYNAFEYYLNEYNTQVKFDNRLQYYSEGKLRVGGFDIKTSKDLSYIINYMNNFLDYANALDIKFIDEFEYFNIEFTEKKYGQDNRINYGLNIYFDIDENGKYIYEFRDEYIPKDNKLETYINNYMNSNNIVL